MVQCWPVDSVYVPTGSGHKLYQLNRQGESDRTASRRGGSNAASRSAPPPIGQGLKTLSYTETICEVSSGSFSPSNPLIYRDKRRSRTAREQAFTHALHE